MTSFNWDRPPIATSPISAVIIARQAEATLAAVGNSLLAYLNKLGRDYEVILVDDGSTDSTPRLAADLAAGNSRWRLLTHDSPRGYGAALRQALSVVQYPLLFTIPADGYQPEDLRRLLEKIDHVDIVTGCRRPRPRVKTQLQGWLAFVAFGLWFKDPACHFRLYRREIFARIPIQSAGCFADVEILAKANFLGKLITEVEVPWHPPTVPIAGPSRIADAWRVFRNPDFGPAQMEAAPTATNA